MNTGHLTDEQFTDLLSDEVIATDVRDHFEGCDDCKAELHVLRETLNDFNDVSAAWALQEAPRRVIMPSKWQIHRHLVPTWCMSLATSFCLVAMVNFYSTERVAPKPQAAIAYSASSHVTPAQIAEDDQLLASINQELASNETPIIPVTRLRDKGFGHSGSLEN